MRQGFKLVWAGLPVLVMAGCVTPAIIDSAPQGAAAPVVAEIENPVYLPLGHDSYGQVFERVLQTLIDEGFEIQESNRYDGHIEALPRVAPGLGLFLKSGSPSLRERLLATLQTYRHRVSVVIQPADNGGYFVEMIARKELEDLERPIRATAGASFFRNDNNVERQFEVIDPTVVGSGWIYKGRDPFLEQRLIDRLKRSL